MISEDQCFQAIKDLYASNSRVRSLLRAIGGDDYSAGGRRLGNNNDALKHDNIPIPRRISSSSSSGSSKSGGDSGSSQGGGGGYLELLLRSIDCRPCSSDKHGEGNARAFLVDNPVNIVMCTNRLKPQDMEEVLVHELVHAYDYKFNHYDFSYCQGLAASEVRAAREAECRSEVKFLPAFLSSICVRSKASIATNNIYPGSGSRCVDEVFDVAINDHRPNLEGKK